MQKIITFLFVGLIGILMAGSIVACGPSYGHRYDRYNDSYRGNFIKKNVKRMNMDIVKDLTMGNLTDEKDTVLITGMIKDTSMESAEMNE